MGGGVDFWRGPFRRRAQGRPLIMRYLLLMIASLLMSGCGIPVDTEPEELVLGVEAPVEPQTTPPEDLAAVSVYLIRDERIVHVTRDLPSPASPDEILRSLLDGVTGPEERANLRTSISTETQLRGLRQQGSVLHVDLSRDFAGVGGEETLAIAQIVLTLTSIEGVESVEFALDGVRTDVPVSDGALSDRPVSADDYQVLVSR
jgi:spore germination protein GerM